MNDVAIITRDSNSVSGIANVAIVYIVVSITVAIGTTRSIRTSWSSGCTATGSRGCGGGAVAGSVVVVVGLRL